MVLEYNSGWIHDGAQAFAFAPLAEITEALAIPALLASSAASSDIPNSISTNSFAPPAFALVVPIQLKKTS